MDLAPSSGLAGLGIAFAKTTLIKLPYCSGEFIRQLTDHMAA